MRKSFRRTRLSAEQRKQRQAEEAREAKVSAKLLKVIQRCQLSSSLGSVF